MYVGKQYMINHFRDIKLWSVICLTLTETYIFYLVSRFLQKITHMYCIKVKTLQLLNISRGHNLANLKYKKIKK